MPYQYTTAKNEPMTDADLDHWTYEMAQGMWDPYLDKMADTLRERLTHRTAMASLSLVPGDRVKLVNVPKYLDGLVGKVSFNGGGRITVEMDSPVQRFGKRIPLRPSQVVPLPKDEATP